MPSSLFSVGWQLPDSVNVEFLWNEAGLSRSGNANGQQWTVGGVDGEGTGGGGCLNKLTWPWLGFLLCMKEQENTLTFGSLKIEGQTCDTMSEESLTCCFLFILSPHSSYPLSPLVSISFSPRSVILSFAPHLSPLPSQSPPLNPHWQFT